MNYSDYFNYLRGRSRLGLFYRRIILYPILCSFLKGRTLDVGCGIGDMLQFRENTTGVDINPANINWCQQKGLDAILIRDNQLPFANSSFGSAIMDNVLEHISEPTALLCEIHRVLVDHGRFIVGVPGKLGFERDPDHKVFYDEKALTEKLVLSRFTKVRLFHTPFRSVCLEKHMRQYCLYGVFEKI